MTCDAFIPLIGLRTEDLSPEERQALAVHVASCPACTARAAEASALEGGFREAGRTLESWPTAPAPYRIPNARTRRPWIPASAAAAILAVGVWKALGPGAPAGPAPQRPGQPVATTDTMCVGPWTGDWAAEADLERAVGANALIALRKGSRLEMHEGVMAFRQGHLHAESFGEPLRFQAGGALLAMDDAEISLATETEPEALAWIRSTHAEGAEALTGRVWRGRIRITLKGRDTVVETGSFRIEGGRVLAVPPVDLWQGRRDWREDRVPSRLVDATRLVLDAPPDRYEWEALVRRRTLATELGIRTEVGHQAFESPAGSLLPVDTWTRIKIHVDGTRVTVVVAGRPLVSERQTGDLWRSATPVPGAGTGIRAWGGAIEVAWLRWRP